MKPRRVLVLLVASLLAASCSASSADESAAVDEPAGDEEQLADGQEPVRIAVVLGGLANDGGFNQYGADAAQNLAEPGEVEVQIRESVQNPSDAEPIFRQFAAEGYDLIVGWGLDFSDSVFKVAEELPDAHFIATGSEDILERSTDNVETWTYAAHELGYLLGWIAGKTNLSPVAVVDGELTPFKEVNYLYASAGLQETNPDVVELEPTYTGSWDDSQLANQAAKAQIDLGAQLIITGAQAFSPGIIAAAKEAGIATIGTSNATSSDAAEVNIGLIELDFTPVLAEALDRTREGSFGNHSYVSTIANRGLVLGDLNHVDAAPDLPADIADQTEELADALARGDAEVPVLAP